jgi:hypothetical protein
MAGYFLKLTLKYNFPKVGYSEAGILHDTQKYTSKTFTFDLLIDSTESQKETVDTYVLHERFFFKHSNPGSFFSSLKSIIRSQTNYNGQSSRSPPTLAS